MLAVLAVLEVLTTRAEHFAKTRSDTLAMLAVMSGIVISTETINGRDGYGIDAPGALIALARKLAQGHVTGLDIWARADQLGNAKAAAQRNAVAAGVAGRVTVETGDIRDPPFPAGRAHMPGGPDDGDRDRGLDDGDVHVVEDGKPDAPALLLLGNAAVPMAIWDPVVPLLAGAHRVIRMDLLGHGKSASPAGGCDIPAQARRVGAALDRLGVSRVTVIGHSSGCTVATALAEQRPGAVAGLALIDMGPNLDAKIPERLLLRLLLTQFPGRLLWRLKTPAGICKGARDSFTRPVDIPDAFIEHTQEMTHREFVGAMRAPLDYLGQRGLPGRLTPLGLPVLVIFGTDDQRWRSSSTVAYRAVPGARVELLPGVGHTPMMEDPQATGALLLEFAAVTGHPH